LERKWISLTLLSIVVPVALLTTFKITGVLREPATIAETKTLEPVEWEIERPSSTIDIDDTVKNLHNDGNVLIDSAVFIGHYVNHFSDYGSSDFVNLLVNVTATLQAGFISSVNITFWEDYENSEAEFFEVNAWPKFYSHVENLSIIDYAHHLWGKGLKAFMELAEVNRPKSVDFGGIVHWILGSPQNHTNQMEVDVELVYFNGTAYKKTVQPFLLEIGPDDNNSFETADEVTVEAYPLYIGGYDTDDYYKIYVNQGYAISVYVNITSALIPNIEIYLYDPEQNYKAHTSLIAPPYYARLNFTADSSGYWFFRIRLLAGSGLYLLTINVCPLDGD